MTVIDDGPIVAFTGTTSEAPGLTFFPEPFEALRLDGATGPHDFAGHGSLMIITFVPRQTINLIAVAARIRQ